MTRQFRTLKLKKGKGNSTSSEEDSSSKGPGSTEEKSDSASEEENSSNKTLTAFRLHKKDSPEQKHRFGEVVPFIGVPDCDTDADCLGGEFCDLNRHLCLRLVEKLTKVAIVPCGGGGGSQQCPTGLVCVHAL